MTVFQVEFPYQWEKDLTEDMLAEIKQIVPQAIDKEGKSVGSWSLTNVILDVQEAKVIMDMGIKLILHRIRGVVDVDKMLRNVDRSITEAGTGNTYHIHLPNNVLHGFTKVEVIGDACTGVIQKWLDDGWRIVCICPPLNKRRPDYIMAKAG